MESRSEQEAWGRWQRTLWEPAVSQELEAMHSGGGAEATAQVDHGGGDGPSRATVMVAVEVGGGRDWGQRRGCPVGLASQVECMLNLREQSRLGPELRMWVAPFPGSSWLCLYPC